jgi:predicted RNA-binding protein with PUA-like domain
MPCWLVKTEPSAYAFADLQRDRKTRWDGISNAQAQANLRVMRAGDTVAVYHSGEKAAVGLARVVRGPYPDPGDADGKRVAVDLAAEAPLGAPVTLEALRAEKAFEGSALLRQGRLSVVPLNAAQWKVLLRLGRAPA